jgi:3-hydroxy-3-methylglutaryl CoA synthase
VSKLEPVGIKAHGAFIPRLRMSRAAIAEAHAWALPALKGMAKGQKSLCSWDEDAITLAVEAGRDCLGPGTPPKLAGITLASTSAPFADLQNSSLVAGALRLDAGVPGLDAAGSTRSGLAALAQSLEALAGDRLVLASERRATRPGSAQEMQYGAGAAALLVGSGDLAARYLGRESVSVPFYDHFRESESRYDYVWEERWIRDEGVARLVPQAVKDLLRRLDLGAEKVAHFGLSGAPGGSDKAVAKTLGIAPERVLPDLQDSVGDTGSAHAPLLLISALERAKPGDIIVVAAFGQGCEVLAFEKQDGGRRPARGLAGSIGAGVTETAYLKMLSFGGEISLDWGPRSENQTKAALTQQYRTADQIGGFVGGRCSACGQVQFPRLPNCVKCAATGTQTPFPLSDEKAKVATYSADWLMYYPAPPLYVGLVQFDAGARVLMEIIEVGAAGIDVGTPLRMAFRIKAHDNLRHYGRYFWKAIPTA